MLTYGFYNSLNHDRRYDAIQMSSIFDGIIRDGIFMSIGTRFQVLADSEMMVTVGTGRAWFNHTWTLNDSLLPITIPQSEVILNRIDAIVIEVNAEPAIRANSIKVVKGTPSSKPVRPTLTNTTTVHQYPLAYISVSAGATSIRQADITSMIGQGSTPYVTGVLETINIESMVRQWEDQWKRFFETQSNDMESTNAFWKAQWRIWFEAQTTEIQEAYQNWEYQWKEFYNSHVNEITDTADYWKDMWQKWFYDYVNNSSRELAYWKKLVTDDFTEYSDFWKAQWRIWFEAQTTEIQEAYLSWKYQWEEFFNSQTTEIQEANKNWKELWESWFYDYVNSNEKEFSDWKNSLDVDFRDWWNSIKDIIDGEDVSKFADELVALKERVNKLEDFQNELTNSHSIHDSLNDSADTSILDWEDNPIEGKLCTFVVEESGTNINKDFYDLKQRMSFIEEIVNNLVNEFTVYQILVDGGTWLYVNNPDADQTEQILDNNGDVIKGKTIFIAK